MKSPSDIIEFEGVSYTYDGKSPALDGLNLQVERGSFVCVLGGNGSGKSTLARHVDALLIPDKGEVRVRGFLTSDIANLYEIRSNSGLVFQNPDDQIVATVVEDDVAFGPENLGVPSSELPDRVSDALRKVGMQGFQKHETFALSGGQKQRVAIAGALAMKPEILVFDEAGAMLDPRGRKGLLKLCRQLNEAGITIVLITHFMDEAALADRVVVLETGRVVMDGTPADVLTKARQLRDYALEVPFAVHMSIALQDAGVPVGTCIDGDVLEHQLAGMLGTAKAGSQNIESAPARPRAFASAPTGDEALITLADVSYSYAPKSARKQEAQGEQTSKPNATHSAPDAPSPASPDRATNNGWGAEADSMWALQDVSFSLNKGDFLGIAGHTGSGKSTLAQLMAGLIHPTEGDVLARGKSMTDKQKMHDVRRAVGLVFQYPEHQLFAPTVFEDVAFGPRNLGLSREEVDERVRSALKSVHLDPDTLEGKSPFELSGGQQRRVALAGVLAMMPSVLILDEPTAGLDPRAHQLFLDLIAELHATSNMATVMVSHNMDDLAELCNRVMLLNKGHLVADGTTKEVFSDEAAIQSIGLDVPHTVHLADSLGLMRSFDHVPTIPQLAERIAARLGNQQAGDAR